MTEAERELLLQIAMDLKWLISVTSDNRNGRDLYLAIEKVKKEINDQNPH